MSALRAIAPLKMPDVVPATIKHGAPSIRLVDPRTLLVDETYQRNLSERSVNLIRRIVGGWDWRSFKPPIVVDADGEMHIVDGQHTAIAAASHPQINKIPVVVAPFGTQADHAMAFVRHNRDRVQVTATQIHYSLVAAGDENAMTVQQVCDRAKVKILKHPPSHARFKPGDTMAVKAIESLVRRRFAKGAREVVEVCAQAGLAPISASALRAVEELLFGESYKGAITADVIVSTFILLGSEAHHEAARFAAEHDLPAWKGLTVTLFRNAKKGRRGRSATA